LKRSSKKKQREKEDNDYIKELEEKHQVKDLTTTEICQRIDARKGEQETYYVAAFWNILLREHDEEVQAEKDKQDKFLKSHGLTRDDMNETVKKMQERLKAQAEEAKKAAEEAEKEEKPKTENSEEDQAEKGEETEEKPQAFPGLENEAGASEEPEEATMSEKPGEAENGTEPESVVTEEPVVEDTTKEPAQEEPVKKEKVQEKKKAPEGDRKNYGSAAYWDERYEKYNDKTEEWYEGWTALRNLIAPYLSKDMLVLDFGCGDSFLQDELQKEGFFCFGTDISDVVLRRLSEKPEREMQTADGFHLPYRTNSWDVIIDKGTLDAIACDEERDLAPLFDEINRVLRPGGRYLCITPWHATKRIPQLSSASWEISHEVQAMSVKTLARQRFNQLRNHPVFGRDKNLLRKNAYKQALNELSSLDLEVAKDLPPERSCVIHCYNCRKKT